MKLKLFTLAALVLIVAMPILAQTTPPPPAPNEGVKFVEDTAFYQLADGSQATVFSARIPVTEYYSGVFSQWFVPSAKGNISMGGVEYRRVLSDIFKKKVINLDLNKFQVFARGQLGSEINSSTKLKSFAYGIEGGIEFPVGTVAGGTIKAGVRFGFLGVPGAKEHFQLGSQATVSPNVSISF